MAKESYVPVTGDDWYQRRREDKEGEFFRKMADQGPRKGQGGDTRQGIYMFTADGKLLAYKNAGQAPDVMREVLKQGLAHFAKLPEEARKPGAVKVEDLDKIDKRYVRTPPANGLILDTYTRILDKNDKKQWCKGTCSVSGGDAAARDHLWLTESEWKALIPADASKGDKYAVAGNVVERIARFHLMDNTRGEPPLWSKEDIRSRAMTLTVTDIDDLSIKLRLDGAVLLASDADLDKAERGFDVRLLGEISYDRVKKAIDRFDMAAIGDHWGEGTFTRNARKGRAGLGVYFELSKGNTAADRVPPQGAREIGEYFRR